LALTKTIFSATLTNVKINPDVLHEARVEALRSRKTLGEWLEDAIEEKVAREEREEKG